MTKVFSEVKWSLLVLNSLLVLFEMSISSLIGMKTDQDSYSYSLLVLVVDKIIHDT